MSIKNQTSESSSANRFSLILLEPGEIYFEDYLVYYHELQCPFHSNILATPNFSPKSSANKNVSLPNSHQYFHLNYDASIEHNNIKRLKGNLKICSKSIVFDPINLSSPLLKFSYKSIEIIEQFDSQNNDDQKPNESFEDIYNLKFNPTEKQKRDQELKQIKKRCFSIRCKQVMQCKLNNKIAPYTIQKRQNSNEQHYFQFIFTDANDSLDLMRQLHRASTLDFEQEDLMLQLILKSRLSRQVKFDLNQLDDMFKEQIQFESEVNKINPLVTNPGKIILSNMCLYYKPFNNLDNERQILKIKLRYIKYVIKRRYHLKKIGCEIIFDNENMTDISLDTRHLPYLYLTFEDEQLRDEFYSKLVFEQKDKLTNLENFSQENMLQKWRYGTISNFDYLMYLNNMADRSYNDLTQYPVFPWVLSEYKSSNLDLLDPKIYRDLSKPIGALNEERIIRLRKRCREMHETTTKLGDENQSNQKIQSMFLYGTHYSTPAFVSFFLVRQMPEWQLCLQNGRFDHPNRLFHNIADTWNNCIQSDSDVKELIPEFYDTNCLSTNSYDDQVGNFLENKLELDLGVRQDNVRVNDVILPQWANNKPSEFIKKMREALESSYVSENLHNWIDLIFGYKQRGQEALKADNLFYYLCYEGAVDLESIKNYSQRKSLEIQIQEFGQIPTQLFNQPHLQRVKIDLISSNLSLEQVGLNETEYTNYGKNKDKNQSNVTFNSEEIESDIFESQDKFKINPTNFKDLSVRLEVKMHKDQVNDCHFIETHKKQLGMEYKLPLVCSVSNDNLIKIYSLEEKSLFRSHNVSDFSLSSVDCIQLTEENDEDSFNRTILFLSCWDNAMYIYDMNYNRCIFSLENAHDDAVSRVRIIDINQDINASIRENSLNEKYRLILTSSWDSLIKVWILPLKKQKVSASNDHCDEFKARFIHELTFESSVIDFQISKSYLASICDDGHLYLWNFDPKKIIIRYENKFDLDVKDNHTNKDYFEDLTDDNELNNINQIYHMDAESSCFNFLSTIQSTNDFGKINDCKIVESKNSEYNSGELSTDSKKLCTIAICTSNGYIKIYNIQTSVEIFSIKLTVPNSLRNISPSLSKLFYSLDYIITIGSYGFVYFIDLKQVNYINSSLKKQSCNEILNSSFLSHTLKLSNNQLRSLCIYKEKILCVGDSTGKTFFLSLIDI